MNNVEVDLILNKFLMEHGIHLEQFGSAEYGLSKSNALDFIKLVRINNRCVLGIEVWNLIQNKYVIYSLGGWYCKSTNIINCYDDAMEFIMTEHFESNALVTIQFD